MNKQNFGRIIILIAFIVIICLSKGIWFFFEGFFTSDNNENRQMAMKPILTLNSYLSFSNDFTKYFNDNLQFREQLISLNSKIDYFIFDKSSNEEVIKGKDGWLYYSDTLADYQGTNIFSSEELEKIKRDVIETKKYFEEMGIEFVIFIGPNKNTIYGDCMPEYLNTHCESSRVHQLVDYLKNNTDVKIIFPDEVLKQTRKSQPEMYYYLHLDTHWNYMGGYFASIPLIESLGAQYIRFDDLRIKEISEPEFYWNGFDEANMLGLSDVLKNDVNYQIQNKDIDNVKYVGDVAHNAEDFNGRIRTYSTKGDKRKIFLNRDSFGEAITPFLASAFREIYSVNRCSFTKGQIKEEKPDIFIFEIVERSINIDTFNHNNWPE